MKLFNLILILSPLLASESKDIPIEASENKDMLSSLEQVLSNAKFSDIDNQASSDKIEGRMATDAEFPKPMRIRTLGNTFAMNFLNYAAATYCPQKEIEKWNCYNCQGFGKNTKDIVHASYDKLKSTAFTGINHEKKIIVASYRGTSNLDNWIINLKFRFIPLKSNDTSSVKIHQGFSEAADVLLYKMRPAILMAMKKNPTYKVVFTGHSLGGALATLSAVKFAEEGSVKWDQIQLITFGQPRVGNLAFADYLDSKPIESARVTTRGDIVPIVPGHMLGYYHSQHIVHMDMKGNPIECSSTQEDPNCFRYFKELTLDAHFTYFNQRLNSNCQDPRTVDPRNWFQRTRDSVVSWWKDIWKKWF